MNGCCLQLLGFAQGTGERLDGGTRLPLERVEGGFEALGLHIVLRAVGVVGIMSACRVGGLDGDLGSKIAGVDDEP